MEAFTKKYAAVLALALIILSAPFALAQEVRTAPGGKHDGYTLEEVVIMSRHNIRSPLSKNGSATSRITPHAWHEWSSAGGELSLKGGALETVMGQYFRKWVVSEGLFEENAEPGPVEARFYANSMQRTIATAQYFSSGFLPIANVRVEHHSSVGTMDPVFHPQLTKTGDAFKALALSQIDSMGGGNGAAFVGQKMAENFDILSRVIDFKDSPAYHKGDTTAFLYDDTSFILEAWDEPGMKGSLKLASQAADALVLQYYEEPDEIKAAFGHELTLEEWIKISEIKDYYGDLLFAAPAIAVNVARPLLTNIRDELRMPGRKFSFLCGHDSNIASLTAALEVVPYKLPGTVECKTPIGSKLVFGRWKGPYGKEYISFDLVYQSLGQIREMSLLDEKNPPVVFPLTLAGVRANAEGFYPYDEFMSLLDRKIAAYEDLP